METRKIDLTPTWAGIMPVLIDLLERGNESGKEYARNELSRLAREVDAANKVQS